MNAERSPRNSEAGLEALRRDWERTFGESMPFGFEIGPEQFPMIRE